MISLVIRTCWVMFIFFVGSAAAYEDEHVALIPYESPVGFRGVQWGTNIATVKQEMVLKEDDGDLKFYSRKKDKLSIGDAKISEIVYGFYKGQLYHVRVVFGGFANFSALKLTLFEKYGTVRPDNQFMEIYSWGTYSPVLTTLQYSEISNKGSFTHTQNKIAEQKAKDDKSKGRDAAKDL